MSWASLRRLQRIPAFHGQPGRFAPRAAIRGFELAAQSQFLTLFASLTPARAVLSGPLHACTGRLVHGLPAQATPKTPACKGPPPRGAPEVLRGRRCRSRALRAPPRGPSQRPLQRAPRPSYGSPVLAGGGVPCLPPALTPTHPAPSPAGRRSLVRGILEPHAKLMCC